MYVARRCRRSWDSSFLCRASADEIAFAHAPADWPGASCIFPALFCHSADAQHEHCSKTKPKLAAMPPQPVTPKKMPFEKYQPWVPVVLTDRTWPNADDHQGAAVVLGRPARRQPGADRPDGPGAQAADVRRPGEDGVQGDRGRLPLREPARLRLRPPADRRGPDPRRRHDPGAGAVPPRSARAYLRVPRRARPRAIVHFYNSTNPLQRRVVFGLDKHGIIDIAVNAAKLRQEARAATGRHRDPLRVLAGELHPDRAGVCDRDLRSGDGRHRADRRAAADPQPAGDRRVLHAERLRRRDRVVRPHDPHRDSVVLSLHPHNDRGLRGAPPPSSG